MAYSHERPIFVPDDDLLETLVQMSRYFGSDPECVLAGGGNTSVKMGDRLWVKASGFTLANIPAEGFVALDRQALDRILESDFGTDPDTREERFKQALMATRLDPEKGQRPSVESLMHHMVSGRFALHAHPTLVNMVTCCREGAALARDLFGEEILWMPYVDPGFTIAQAMRNGLREHAARTGMAAPRAVLMQNHGLIVYGDSPDTIRETIEWLINGVRERLACTSDGEPFGVVERVAPELAKSR